MISERYHVGFLRIRTPLVLRGDTIEAQKHEHDDAADKRYQRDEVPPAAFSGIVKTPHGHRESRNDADESNRLHSQAAQAFRARRKSHR